MGKDYSSLTVKEIYEIMSKFMEQGKGDYEVYVDNSPEYLCEIRGDVEVNEEDKEIYI